MPKLDRENDRRSDQSDSLITFLGQRHKSSVDSMELTCFAARQVGWAKQFLLTMLYIWAIILDIYIILIYSCQINALINVLTR